MSISGYPTNPVNPPAELDQPDEQHDHMTEEEQVALVRALRKQAASDCRIPSEQMASPIHVMARMVKEVQLAALKAGVSPVVLRRGVLSRTTGAVNVRCS